MNADKYFLWGEKHTSNYLLKTLKSIKIYLLLWAIIPAFAANFSGIAWAGNLYTIHCASYKNAKQAAADVKNLTAIGHSAFFIEVQIKGKGKWFRVYTGKYETKEKARLAAEEMVKKKIIPEYFIFPLPAKQPVYFKAGDKEILPQKDEQADSKKKQTEKKPAVQINQDKQYRQAIVKNDAAALKIKNITKLQDTPHALPADKSRDNKKNVEQVSLEKEEPNSGSLLYDQALRELKEKKYDKSLVTFKEFVSRADTSNDLGERALRHMADCHFYLGEKGSIENLRIAVQFYLNTLQSFPDQKRDNSMTYFRLAKSYEYLNNYLDSLNNYENLLSKYPQSAYVPEAFFKTGALLHKTGKYSQAVDKLIAYLMKYRGGAYAKQAYYLTADCYYKMQQSTSAEVWFRDALKKWPDFKDIAQEVIRDMAQHEFSLRHYEEAIKIFSFYANVYSHDEKIKEITLGLAHSYKAAEQVSAALNIYNLIIDKYPESKESSESILAMASLGIDRPHVKVFFALNNVHYYKHPLEAYDLVLMKNPSEEIAQSALFQKGNALHKLKRDRKAADSFVEFLKKYPQSKMTDEVKKSLKIACSTLIDESYEKKDYLAVADIYFKAYRNVPLQADEYEIVNKMAASLDNIGLSDDNVILLRNYLSICKDDKICSKIMIRIAEAQIAGREYDEAEKILGELTVKASIKNAPLMVAIKKNMAEIAYRKHMYDKAIAYSDAVIKSRQNVNDAGLLFWRYAASLKEKKEDSLALHNYLIAVKYFDQDKQSLPGLGDVYRETGDLYFKTSNFNNSLSMYNKALSQSSDTDLKNWHLFSIGQVYIKMDKNADAQKIFTKIKAQSNPEGFWAKIVDYYVSDQQWWNKYGEFVQK